MKHLIITFDYELFLGRRSGKPDDCLIRPTKKLQELLSQYNAKAIFFVDTTYLITLKELSKKNRNCQDDLEKISKQLQELLIAGHYIFPHIHPHWLDAIYIPHLHEFDLKNVNRYRFHNLESAEREMIFGDSMELLSSILHRVDPSYEINGYRAGGWSIQPFGDIKPFFEHYQIQYDFSVMPGMYQFSNAQYFDFSLTPPKPVYRFTNDVTHEDSDGSFTQISSTVIQFSPYTVMKSRILNKLLHLTRENKAFGAGKGQIPQIIKGITPHSALGKSTYDPQFEFASIELMNVATLSSYLEYLKVHDYMHFVSHPKMINNHSMYVMKRFMDAATKNHKIQTDFKQVVDLFLTEKVEA